MNLKKILNNLVKPVEIAPDGFLLTATGIGITYYAAYNNIYLVPLGGIIFGVGLSQYRKGIISYTNISKHIKKHGTLDERFLSFNYKTPCFRFGMRCATRNYEMLEQYEEIVSRLNH